MGLGSPTQLSERSRRHVFYNEPFFVGFLVLRWSSRVCIPATCTVWGGSFLWLAGVRMFLPLQNVVQAVSQELYARSHWERVLQEGSQAGGMAQVPSPHHQCCPCANVFRPRPQKCCVASLPGGLSTSEGSQTHCLNRRNEMRGRGMEQRDPCGAQLWAGIMVSLL